MLTTEALEERQLLSLGEFFQGVVTNNGGAPLAGATVQLYSADGSTLYGQTTSDANGEYVLDDSKVDLTLLSQGIQPNTQYLLKEIPPSGFQNNGDSFNTQIDQVTSQTLSSMIVTLAAGPQTVTVTNPLTAGSQQTLLISPGGNHLEDMGQPTLLVGPVAGGGTASILSACVDLFSPVGQNQAYSTTLQSSSTFFTMHADNIAYLFNKYGTNLQSNDLAAALQLAIWKLEYDNISDFSNADFTTGRVVYPSQVDTGNPNILALAKSLIAESAGQHALAAVFDYPGGDNGQSMLVTRSFNFDNKPQVLTPKGSISGIKFNDLTGNGITSDDVPIGGFTIDLYIDSDSNGMFDSNDTLVGQRITDPVTGAYSFTQLDPGLYFVKEEAVAGWVQTAPVSPTFYTVNLGPGAVVPGENFANFKTPPLQQGDAATMGFWANKNGQALITSLNGGPTATSLGNWLYSNFPNLFPTLNGATNTQVAAYFKSIKAIDGTPKVEAQVMAVALATYVTSSNLAGNAGTAYGFNVTPLGIGGILVNSGISGAPLGLQNNTNYTILQLLQAANAVAASTPGQIDPGNNTARGNIEWVFNYINTTGDIV